MEHLTTYFQLSAVVPSAKALIAPSCESWKTVQQERKLI